jgi:hypothetical protein
MTIGASLFFNGSYNTAWMADTLTIISIIAGATEVVFSLMLSKGLHWEKRIRWIANSAMIAVGIYSLSMGMFAHQTITRSQPNHDEVLSYWHRFTSSIIIVIIYLSFQAVNAFIRRQEISLINKKLNQIKPFALNLAKEIVEMPHNAPKKAEEINKILAYHTINSLRINLWDSILSKIKLKLKPSISRYLFLSMNTG